MLKEKYKNYCLKEIEDQPGYYVDTDGNVYSIKRGKYKRLKPIENEYYEVILYQNGNTKKYKIHRLVATVFISNPENKSEVNHKDGDKFNNKLSNLEWCTHSENIRHAIEMGLKPPTKGSKIGNSKLKECDVRIIRIMSEAGIPGSKIARLYNISQTNISDIKYRRCWSWL